MLHARFAQIPHRFAVPWWPAIGQWSVIGPQADRSLTTDWGQARTYMYARTYIARSHAHVTSVTYWFRSFTICPVLMLCAASVWLIYHRKPAPAAKRLALVSLLLEPGRLLVPGTCTPTDARARMHAYTLAHLINTRRAVAFSYSSSEITAAFQRRKTCKLGNADSGLCRSWKCIDVAACCLQPADSWQLMVYVGWRGEAGLAFGQLAPKPSDGDSWCDRQSLQCWWCLNGWWIGLWTCDRVPGDRVTGWQGAGVTCRDMTSVVDSNYYCCQSYCPAVE